MNIIKTLFLSLFILSTLCSANTQTRNTPKGYTWSNSGPKNTNFLMPKNWHLTINQHNSIHKITISKEKSSKEKKFSTGLTINALTHVKENTKLKPTQYSKRFINNFFEVIKYKRNGLLHNKPKSEREGDFIVYTIEFQDDTSIMRHILLANDKKDILYMIMFEAPYAKWKQAWKKGKVIINNMIIDDNI